MPKYILEFHALAQEEVKDAYLYYESNSPGLGDKFLDSLDTLFDLISENPKLYSTDFNEIRKAPLKKFPFSIYYEIVGDKILVYSVFHQKRNPDDWKGKAQ